MTRDYVVLRVNETRCEARGHDAVRTVSDYVRNVLRLTGTKTACGTGDCGSCTVLLAKPGASADSLLAVNACLLRVAQVDGCQLRTVESCATHDMLSAVQTAMIETHGSQCGFCTPGFVMSMTAALHAAGTDPHAIDWPTALAGNLCRCTGYVAIFDAAQRATEALRTAERTVESMTGIAETGDAGWIHESAQLQTDSMDMLVSVGDRSVRVIRPSSLGEALGLLATLDEVTVVAGATDLGVDWSDDTRIPRTMLLIGGLRELGNVTRVTGSSDRDSLIIGSVATWSALHAACNSDFPELAALLVRVGGPQIRNIGTIGGNLVTGSSIADLLPVMLVMDATVELQSHQGVRTVPLSAFLRGSRDVDRLPGELLTRIVLPLPTSQESVQLTKVSRRLDVDIATLTLATRLRVANGILHDVAIAVGGAGPIAKRLTETERFLMDASDPLSRSRDAADVAAGEINPRSDVRGSAQYRELLLRNLLNHALATANDRNQLGVQR